MARPRACDTQPRVDGGWRDAGRVRREKREAAKWRGRPASVTGSCASRLGRSHACRARCAVSSARSRKHQGLRGSVRFREPVPLLCWTRPARTYRAAWPHHHSVHADPTSVRYRDAIVCKLHRPTVSALRSLARSLDLSTLSRAQANVNTCNRCMGAKDNRSTHELCNGPSWDTSGLGGGMPSHKACFPHAAQRHTCQQHDQADSNIVNIALASRERTLRVMQAAAKATRPSTTFNEHSQRPCPPFMPLIPLRSCRMSTAEAHAWSHTPRMTRAGVLQRRDARAATHAISYGAHIRRSAQLRSHEDDHRCCDSLHAVTGLVANSTAMFAVGSQSSRSAKRRLLQWSKSGYQEVDALRSIAYRACVTYTSRQCTSQLRVAGSALVAVMHADRVMTQLHLPSSKKHRASFSDRSLGSLLQQVLPVNPDATAAFYPLNSEH